MTDACSPSGAAFFEADLAALTASRDLFLELDRDANGYLSAGEMRSAQEVMLQSSPVHALSDDLPRLIVGIDGNGDGRVDKEEWEDFCGSVYEVAGRKRFLAIVEGWIDRLQDLPSKGSRPPARMKPRKPSDETRSNRFAMGLDNLPQLSARSNRGSAETADESALSLTTRSLRSARADDRRDSLPVVPPRNFENDRGGHPLAQLQIGGAVGSGTKARSGPGASAMQPTVASQQSQLRPALDASPSAGKAPSAPLAAPRGKQAHQQDSSGQGVGRSRTTAARGVPPEAAASAQRKLVLGVGDLLLNTLPPEPTPRPGAASQTPRLPETGTGSRPAQDAQAARQDGADTGGMARPSGWKDLKGTGQSPGEASQELAEEPQARRNPSPPVEEAAGSEQQLPSVQRPSIQRRLLRATTGESASGRFGSKPASRASSRAGSRTSSRAPTIEAASSQDMAQALAEALTIRSKSDGHCAENETEVAVERVASAVHGHLGHAGSSELQRDLLGVTDRAIASERAFLSQSLDSAKLSASTRSTGSKGALGLSSTGSTAASSSGGGASGRPGGAASGGGKARKTVHAVTAPSQPRTAPAAPRRTLTGCNPSEEVGKAMPDEDGQDPSMEAAAARIQAIQRGKMARRKYKGKAPKQQHDIEDHEGQFLVPASIFSPEMGTPAVVVSTPTSTATTIRQNRAKAASRNLLGEDDSEIPPEASGSPPEVDELNAAVAKIQALHRGKMVRRQTQKVKFTKTAVKAPASADLSRVPTELADATVEGTSDEADEDDECARSVGTYPATPHPSQDQLEQAATRIQAIQRGKLARRDFDTERKSTIKAASKIQASIRGRKSRRDSLNALQSAVAAKATGDADAAVARPEEPRTTMDEAWELMTMQMGFVTNQLRVVDFVHTFRLCKESGLGRKLVEFVPQDLPEDIAGVEGFAPDLSIQEFAHLCSTLVDCPGMPDQDVQDSLEQVKGVLIADEGKDVITDPDEAIGFALFKRIIALITYYTHVDEEHILAHLLWAKTGCFEMTRRMATVLMERCFQRRPGPNGSVLEQVVQNNDVLKACFVGGLVDKHGRTGVQYSTLSLTFSATVRKMPELLQARANVRVGIRGHKPTARKYNAVPQAFNIPAAVRGLAGRTELSVLMEELFKVLPGGVYRSPLSMLLSMFEATPLES